MAPEFVLGYANVASASAAFSGYTAEDLEENLGCLSADTAKDKPFPMGVNGKPIFGVIHLMRLEVA